MSDLSPETLAEMLSICEKATPGPYFVSFDNAEECGPHKQSGLAMIDTGRSADCPIARLCEWPTAQAIATALEHLPLTIKELIAARDEIERLRLIETYAHNYEVEFSKWIIEDGSKVLNLGDCSIQIWHNIILPLRAELAETRKRLEAISVRLKTPVAELCDVVQVDIDNASLRAEVEEAEAAFLKIRVALGLDRDSNDNLLDVIQRLREENERLAQPQKFAERSVTQQLDLRADAARLVDEDD